MPNHRPQHAIGKHRKPSKKTIQIIKELFKTKEKDPYNEDTILLPAIRQ